MTYITRQILTESGVAGADRVKSRADFAQFLKDYEKVLAKFPGFVSMKPSGSYNSDLAKQDFGDIDLIVHITSDKDKATVKKELQAFFTRMPETVIVPFTSEKHAGKRTYNAGELVSVRYHDDLLGYSAQIDNIVALDQSEASFKQQFLDLPAEKQGLVLGLTKIATIETDPQILFKKLGITAPPLTEPNQEYEFNLSSVEIQLRKVTYKPGTYEQAGREVIWTSRDFDALRTLLYQYDLDAGFDQLLAQSKKTIRNPRSNNRMQGVFSSMISVKSGEVGTAKGAGKEAALNKVKQTFKENNIKTRYIAKTNITDTASLIEHVKSLRKWMALEGVAATFEINDIKKLCSRILYPATLTEDLAKDRLKFINQLSKLDQYKSLNIKVGSKVSILNVMITGNYVELWGFTIPKRISKITFDKDDNIKQFEFNNDPTDVYPRSDLATYNGEEIQHSAFFGDSKSATQAIAQLGLVNSDLFTIRNHVTESIITKEKVKQTFGEGRSRLLNELVKPATKTVVMAFGRFQPPTIGHKLLIDTVQHAAQSSNADAVVYVSRTQDHKTNPLTVDQKIYYLKKMFPTVNFVAANDQVRTPIEAVRHLNNKYNNLIMVAGSDRSTAFQELLNKYNGAEFNYHTAKVISSGDRDPDSDDASGMSGTKMRAAAIDGNFKVFRQGLPNTLNNADAEQLMKDIQAGLVKPPRKAPVKKVNAPVETFDGGSPEALKRGTGNASYVSMKSKEFESKQRLDPKCWKGYKKSGTKMKGGTRVNNCVKIGESYENKIASLIEQLKKK